MNLLRISERFLIDQNQLLGKGSTGNVYLAVESTNHNKKYAVKAIDLTKIDNPVTQYLLSCQIVSLTDLSQQSCNHIVKLQTQPIFHGQLIYLVMQLLQGGSLAEIIRQNYQGLRQIQALNLFQQIFQAYRVINNLGIIHRDIKPDNLIFRKIVTNYQQNLSESELCFIDFGYCLKQSVPNPPQCYYNVGSPKYMSPQAYKKGIYSQKSDIWAMGVILYEMLHGTTIDTGMDMQQYFQRIERKDFKNQKGISPQLWVLMMGMLQRRPQNRWGLGDIQRKLQQIRGKIQNQARPLSIASFPINQSVNSPQNIIIGSNQHHQANQNQQPKVTNQQQLQRVLTSVPNQQYSTNFHVQSQNTKQIINNLQINKLSDSNKSPIQQQQFRIKNPLNISERFLIDQDQLLGKGSTGNVYLGFQTQNYNKKYAVKAIDLSKITNPVTQFLLSCEIVALTDLKELNCRHIVKLQEIVFREKYIYLVMQLLQGGSLADHIGNHFRGIDESQAIELFGQIFQAYGFLMSLQIIHRDIKPDNLIFRKPKISNEQNQSENQLCFIDFGYCLKQSVPNKPQGYYNVGSPKYMPPQAYKAGKYSQKSDIWAMGVILYEMLHGTTVDSGLNMQQYFDTMEKLALQNRKGINAQIWQLVVGMLRYEVQQRFGYNEIKQRLERIHTTLGKRSIVDKKNSTTEYFNQHQTFIDHHQPNNFISNETIMGSFNIIGQSPPNGIPILNLDQKNQNQRIQNLEPVNLDSKRSQKKEQIQKQHVFQKEVKYLFHSNIFPSQNQNNQEKMVRSPSLQRVKQDTVKVNPDIRMSLPTNVSLKNLNQSGEKFISTKVNEANPGSFSLKRSFLARYDYNDKPRKISKNITFNNNQITKFETVYKYKGVNQTMNDFRPRQSQQIRNPIIIQSKEGTPKKKQPFIQIIGDTESFWNSKPSIPRTIQYKKPGQWFNMKKKSGVQVPYYDGVPAKDIRSDNLIAEPRVENYNDGMFRREKSVEDFNRGPMKIMVGSSPAPMTPTIITQNNNNKNMKKVDIDNQLVGNSQQIHRDNINIIRYNSGILKTVNKDEMIDDNVASGIKRAHQSEKKAHSRYFNDINVADVNNLVNKIQEINVNVNTLSSFSKHQQQVQHKRYEYPHFFSNIPPQTHNNPQPKQQVISLTQFSQMPLSNLPQANNIVQQNHQLQTNPSYLGQVQSQHNIHYQSRVGPAISINNNKQQYTQLKQSHVFRTTPQTIYVNPNKSSNINTPQKIYPQQQQHYNQNYQNNYGNQQHFIKNELSQVIPLNTGLSYHRLPSSHKEITNTENKFTQQKFYPQSQTIITSNAIRMNQNQYYNQPIGQNQNQNQLNQTNFIRGQTSNLVSSKIIPPNNQQYQQTVNQQQHQQTINQQIIPAHLTQHNHYGHTFIKQNEGQNYGCKVQPITITTFYNQPATTNFNNQHLQYRIQYQQQQQQSSYKTTFQKSSDILTTSNYNNNNYLHSINPQNSLINQPIPFVESRIVSPTKIDQHNNQYIPQNFSINSRGGHFNTQQVPTHDRSFINNNHNNTQQQQPYMRYG